MDDPPAVETESIRGLHRCREGGIVRDLEVGSVDSLDPGGPRREDDHVCGELP
jgi:hypothetical protein